MNQPQRYQNQRPPQQGHGRMQPQGRMKEQRHEDDEGQGGEQEGNGQELSLDQHAGAVARGIIKSTGVEDTTQIWRALKRAYLTGYGDAQQ